MNWFRLEPIDPDKELVDLKPILNKSIWFNM